MSAQQAQSYWSFVDGALENPKVFAISAMGFGGQEMVAELKQGAPIDFGSFSINFSDDVWDFSVFANQVTVASTLRMEFCSGDGEDMLKLFLLCLIVWRDSKIQTCITKAKYALLAFRRVGLDVQKDYFLREEVHRLLDVHSDYSQSQQYQVLSSLRSFLDFRRVYFNMPVDVSAKSMVDDKIKELGMAMWHTQGTQEIPDEYLNPLLEASLAAVKDEQEEEKNRIAAASILIASQVGLRISEMVSLEYDSLTIEQIDEERAVATMSFKVYKGAKGDGSYKMAHSIMNPIALEGFYFLREKCSSLREEMGSSALIVTRGQKGMFPAKGTLRRTILNFIFDHRSVIPCINTQDVFPELQMVYAKECESIRRLSVKNMEGNPIFVYPKFHQFRATVATKLYEAGVDMRYIRKHMSHLNEDTTASYINSGKRIEKNYSDLVYRALIEDGADLLGSHADEFMVKVNRYVARIGKQVKMDIDSVIESTSKKFPLRMKVGGVCIRCGMMEPCHSSDDTDSIYCAFGVCPNQCQLYFMLPECLAVAREHMKLVAENSQRGFVKAARNELRKAQNTIAGSIVPEIESLERQLVRQGKEGIVNRFPDMEDVIDNLAGIKIEVASWQAMNI